MVEEEKRYRIDKEARQLYKKRTNELLGIGSAREWFIKRKIGRN